VSHPPQQEFLSPTQAPGTPPQSVEPVPQPKGSNGFAIAALIFGIIGGSVLGLIFGIVGLIRSKKVNSGKAMSWIGIVLSTLWLVGQIIFVVVVVTKVADTVSKANDAGCVAYQTVTTTYSEEKIAADASDPTALMADFSAIATGLNSAASRSESAEAKAAIQAEAGHIQAFVAAVTSGGTADPGFVATLEADDKAIATACGLTLIK
jgi:hypothetical protein